MLPPSFNRVLVDRNALVNNYNLLKNRAISADFLAMVKGDSYGHGMEECSRILEEQGCGFFGVAELREAVQLRNAGIVSPIFAMIGMDHDYAQLICQYDITPVVYDLDTLTALSQVASKLDREVAVHVKIDSGMSRLGVTTDKIQQFILEAESLPGVCIAGFASHFPRSDEKDSSSTEVCFKRFTDSIENLSLTRKLVTHIANSGAVFNFPETHGEIVRCGISLYGYYPDGKIADEKIKLKPVMSFKTRVVQVKNIPAGAGVSYGHTYVTERPTRLAVLPVGYEDGYSRQLTNRGEVLIRGKRAPIRGRVCMNLCLIDVTDIAGVEKGDEVVLLGSQDEQTITADEIASHIGTISYEVLCMIGNNNEREYI